MYLHQQSHGHRASAGAATTVWGQPALQLWKELPVKLPSGGLGAAEKASGRRPAQGGGFPASLHDGCTLQNGTTLGSSTQTLPISLRNDGIDVTTNY